MARTVRWSYGSPERFPPVLPFSASSQSLKSFSSSLISSALFCSFRSPFSVSLCSAALFASLPSAISAFISLSCSSTRFQISRQPGYLQSCHAVLWLHHSGSLSIFVTELLVSRCPFLTFYISRVCMVMLGDSRTSKEVCGAKFGSSTQCQIFRG